MTLVGLSLYDFFLLFSKQNLMTSSQSSTPPKLSRWLQLILIAFLTLGIILRFTNLDQKNYWLDEVATSLRLGGYTIADVSERFYDNQIVTVADLQKYQSPAPDKTIIDTINSLVADDPQHPPLYYIILQLWSKVFGNAPAVLRLVSVIASLLTFPCLYWLCIELSEAIAFRWITLATSSVSLLYILYAQEAREFSLWILTIVLSNIAFFRAMRIGSKSSFTIYAGSLVLGFYTFPLTALVAFGHALYVLVIERAKITRNLIYFFTSAIAGSASFLPWMWFVLNNKKRVSETVAWMYVNRSWQELIDFWSVNFTGVFVHYSKFRLVFLVLFLSLLYLFYRKASKSLFWFVVTSTASSFILFLLADLIFNTSFSSTFRYLWPFMLGTQLYLCYVLSYMINSTHSKGNWLKVAGVLILIGTLALSSYGSVSMVVEYGEQNSTYSAAKLINESESPLVLNYVGDKENLVIGDVGDVFSLSYYVKDTTKFLLYKQPSIPKITEGFSDIYLFYVFHGIASEFEPVNLESITNQGYQVEPVDLAGDEKTIFWKIKPLAKST
ncbi:MAG: hypothetical protein DCE90_17480 [Pseudanabaena sp.]|nr:MAG: hypothetical protein DCE90_17480 [Pseudanabaena sp.]